MKDLLRAARPLTATTAILAAALVLVAGHWTLPPSLAGLREAGPYAALGAAVAVAAWFNRGRVLVFAASLLIAYMGYMMAGAAGGFAPRAVYTAMALLVPANVLVALAMPDRGVAHHHDYRWLLAVAVQILLVAWVASSGRSAMSGLAWQALLEHWSLRAPPMPWLGRLLLAAALAAAAWRAWPRQSRQEIGIAGALIAFYVACEWPERADVFAVFLGAAGAILVVAVLQESHRMAFNDELTGLPGRRALQESLAALGPHYAIAMVDVDHFKKFNDTHGHDIGDQVLKLVAAQLDEVGGGGRAYRYGGEEFAVLFPGRGMGDALPHLEEIRAAIETYPMAVRGDDRPKLPEDGLRRRRDAGPAKTLSVTVSIGVAEPGAKHATPAQVIKAADKALYRAKEAGRNRVSR
ncbi:MAG: diguanylate cyclase [Burkholderiales bacterium]